MTMRVAISSIFFVALTSAQTNNPTVVTDQGWGIVRGINWESTPSHHIPGQNMATLTGKTLAECKAACEAEPLCNSFDRGAGAPESAQTCWLSDAPSETEPSSNSGSYDFWKKVPLVYVWETLPGYAITSNNIATETGLSVEECKVQCLNNPDGCGSFDHSGSDETGTCYFNSATPTNEPSPNGPYTLYRLVLLTSSPTKLPTMPPQTSLPSNNPTTSVPTNLPTMPPQTSLPSNNPTTSVPTNLPTMPPQTSLPSNNPTTSAPTKLPTMPPATSAPTGFPGVSLRILNSLRSGFSSLDYIAENVTSTEIEPAFKNSPAANRLSKVPTFLLGRTHFRMEHSMPKGTMFEFDCPAGAVCDLFVFHVHEPPCSSDYNGNYPALLADDWTPMSCAPRLQEATDSYRTVGYHKQIGGQTKWTVPAVETDCLSYFGVFAGEGTSCDDNAYQNQNACLNAIAAGALCKWESNACVADLCSRPERAAGGGGAACKSLAGSECAS